MAAIKICETCGGICEYKIGKGYVCTSCGNKYPGDEYSDDVIENLNFANQKRSENYDFDGALSLCEEILAKEPKNLEANWCALLAKYKIVYLKNKKGEFRPTLLEPNVETPINQCEYYKKLNVEYRRMADLAEEVRLEVLRASKQIPPYDVFISYKQHVGDSSVQTAEATLAAEIYRRLTKSGLTVFYDKVSLDGNAGWEPHIYSALKTAKYLIVLGSSVENINSPWVKNEWKRFLYYRKRDKNKEFAVVYMNFNVEDLDNALRSNQNLSAESADWQTSLYHRIEDHLITSKNKVDYLLYEAEADILKRKFKKAKQSYTKVCDADPQNAKAHWGILMCNLKAMDDYDLVKCRKKIGKRKDFDKARECAEGEEKQRYEQVAKDNLKHDTTGYERKNYNEWQKKTKVLRGFKKLFIVCLIFAICVFGVYSYFGITQPVNYIVANGEAGLNGRSIYFDCVISDLVVDSYKGCPVVSINSSALKSSNLKSVTLGDSVTQIGSNAFEDCKELTSVTIERCLYLGSNVFSGCLNLTEVKIGITDDTQIEADAFANIGGNVTISCPTVAEKVVAKLKKDYPNLMFTTFTLDKVEECIYFIAKLEEASFEDEANLQRAENLYNALSSDEKSKVTNYAILQNALAAYDTMVAINAIGEITLDSEAAIVAAENMYNSLTVEQQKTVQNREILKTARAVFNAMSLIDSIGEVQLNSEPKIAEAEEAYFALNNEQRDLVTNYNLLTAARISIDIMLSNAVMEKIAQIDETISLDSEAMIIDAESSYNSLTDEQKSRVTNYDTLVDARNIYRTIKAIDNIKDITVNSGSMIASAQTLYDNLTSLQKLKVPNYTDLVDAIAVYPVVEQIDSIGIVTITGIDAIEKAEAAYANLSASQQAKVSNHNVLVDSAQACTAVRLIEKIGTVTKDSYNDILTAQNIYESLTNKQRNLVGNYGKLADAQKVYNTITAINAIGTVGLGSRSKIEVAESAYNALSTTLQNKVTNYSTLRDARAVYNVMVLIDSIGTVTASSRSAIETAKSAYYSLTASQRNNVGNYYVLQKALSVWDSLNDTINFMGGTGTADNPYLIGNKQHFQNISKFKNSCFLLTSNLDLETWNSPFDFAGNLNGNGYTVSYSQTQFTAGSGEYYGGLFTVLSNATVKNLRIDVNCSYKISREYIVVVGGLAGKAKDYTQISRVYISGSIVPTYGNGEDYIGGVVGVFHGGVIDQCANAATIEDHARIVRIGGIVSYIEATSSNVNISNCYNIGTLKACTAHISGGRSAGGIIGQVKGNNAYQLDIQYCYNDGTVKVILDQWIAGGWSGCGGIFGDIRDNKSNNIVVQQCFWNKTKSELSGDSASFHQNNSKDNMSGTYSGWSTQIWKFSDNAAPQLRWLQR